MHYIADLCSAVCVYIGLSFLFFVEHVNLKFNILKHNGFVESQFIRMLFWWMLHFVFLQEMRLCYVLLLRGPWVWARAHIVNGIYLSDTWAHVGPGVA